VRIDYWKKIARLVGREAERQNLPPEQFLDGLRGRPKYIVAAEKIAAERGITSDEVLYEQSERIRKSHYPTELCLDPDEVEEYVAQSGALTREKAEHLASCPFCSEMVDATRPSEEKLQDELQWLTAAAAAKQQRESDEDLAIPEDAHI